MEKQTAANVRTAAQVFCGVAIACNVLVLVVFVATKRLRVKYYGFVLSLAVADVVFATSYIAFRHLHGYLTAALYRTAFFAAELNVLAVAVNRLLALSTISAARYDGMVTPCRMVFACLLMWAVSALIYFPTTYFWTPIVNSFIRPLITLVILVVTGVLYLAVFRKIALYRPPLASTPGLAADHDQANTRVRQTRHLTITFSIILLVSFICWVPYSVANFMIFFSASQNYHNQSESFRVFYSFCGLFLVLNSTVNPFIYWWRIGEFRNSLYRLITCGRHQQPADASEGLGEMEVTTIQSCDYKQ